MNSKTLFYCGLDCQKYYLKIIEKTEDNKIIYSLDNSDCQYDEYLTIDEAFNEMFDSLKYHIDGYFGETEGYDLHFFKRNFIIPKTYISKELIKRVSYSNYVIVKFKFSGEIRYSITTERIYNKYKDEFKLIIVKK
jgi:hypothetical protein